MIKFVQDHFTPPLQDLQLLFRFESTYQAVQNQGGFAKLYCQRTIPNILLQDDAITLFKEYLLSYELQCIVKGSYLERVNYIPDSDAIRIYQIPSSQWITHQISVWTLPDSVIELINHQYFTLDALRDNHGKQPIDVLLQSVDYDQFQTGKGNQQIQGLTINNYIDYLDDPKKFNRKYGLVYNSVLFAVNVDMDGWDSEIKHINSILPKTIQAQELGDGLSYLRQQVLGVNVPQIYIKQEGVWTGGHQENISVNAININHGPGDCVWYSIDNEHVENIRAIVLEQFNVDILKNEGLWFKNINYFLEHDVRIKQTIQKKGDVIILGAGCLHWVKALETTVNSAWNYLCMNKDGFNAMSQRHKINVAIDYRTVIPYKNLLLDIFIHEKQLDIAILNQIQLELITFFEEDNQKALKFECPVVYDVDCRNVQLCSICGLEIFIYFFADDKECYCLNCPPNDKKSMQIIAKYKYPIIYCILQQQPQFCSIEYCSLYTGKTKCTIQSQFKNDAGANKSKLNSMLHGGEQLKKIQIQGNNGEAKEHSPVNPKRKRKYQLKRNVIDDDEDFEVLKKVK